MNLYYDKLACSSASRIICYFWITFRFPLKVSSASLIVSVVLLGKEFYSSQTNPSFAITVCVISTRYELHKRIVVFTKALFTMFWRKACNGGNPAGLSVLHLCRRDSGKKRCPSQSMNSLSICAKLRPFGDDPMTEIYSDSTTE